MATKKKLLQAAAGSAGGDVVNVEDVFATHVFTGNARTQDINNGILLGDSYPGRSIYFDGYSYLERSSVWDNLTDGTDLTLSFWIKTSDSSSQATVMRTSNGRIEIIIQSEDIVFEFKGTNGTKYFAGSVSNNAIGNGDWNHIMLSRTTNSAKLYINGVDTTITYNPGPGTEILDFTDSGGYGIGGRVGGSFLQKMNLAHFFFDDTYYDLSQESNRLKFRTASGETTSGLADLNPVIYLPFNDFDDPAKNLGTGGTITAINNPRIVQNGPAGVDSSSESGKGGAVWVKSRSNTTNHILANTERGVLNYLKTNSNDPEGAASMVTSFNKNGFTVGSSGDINEGNYTYTSWTFRKQERFFDIVEYTGNGVFGRTVSHNLGSVPGAIIVKAVNATRNWPVYHRKMHDTLPADYKLVLDEDSGRVNSANIWADTLPTATEFTVGTDGETNNNGTNYIAFIFAHNDDDGEFGPNGDLDIIKCGTYTGDGTTNGSKLVDVGFEPQWVLIRNIGAVENWLILDNMRGAYYDEGETLFANLTQAGSTQSRVIYNFDSQGFRLGKNNTDSNDNGANYLYIAIRKGMTGIPAKATDVFDVNTYTASGAAGNHQNSGFPVDLTLIAPRSGTDSWKHGVLQRQTTGLRYLQTNSDAQLVDNGASGINLDNMTGYDFDGAPFNNSNDMYNLMWRTAHSFCDVTMYRGNGTSGNTVSHNLGVVPEMIWVKPLFNTDHWHIYHSAITADNYMIINENVASTDSATVWNDTEPTSSVFTLGNNGGVNGNGNTYIAYLFASLDGVSKVGSYTGNGTGQNIDCGFSSGARFVLVKNSTNTKNWFVFDTERGITTGNDPYLKLNDTSAEGTTFDLVDPYSNGFAVTGSNSGINASGDTYIFYAIA